MTGSETHHPVTPVTVGRILWRQRVVSAVLFVLIAAVGCTVVLVRPTTYQSSSSIALLPVSTNASVLPNYPNLITSLIPTYVQLVSSPILLDKVAAGLPFETSGTALASNVSAQSLSNAAVINIVVRSRNATQARQIATETTRVFVSELSGNGVVVPKIYALPSASSTPAPPKTSLLLILTLLLAALLALAAGLIWDRLSAPARLRVDGPIWPGQTDRVRTRATTTNAGATVPGTSSNGGPIGDGSDGMESIRTGQLGDG